MELNVPEHIKEMQAWKEFERQQELPTTDVGVLGIVLTPETLSDLTLCLQLGGAVGVFAWRGQADASWGVHSTLYRRLDSERRWLLKDEAVEEAVALEAELRLIERARLGGHDREDGRTLSDLEVLARLRHHGAATRLLDVSRSAYVAAWFASNGHPDKPGAIIGFGERSPYRIDSARRTATTISALLDAMGERVASWAPSGLSPRLAAQQGLFIFGRISNESWGSLPLGGDVVGKGGAVPDSLVIALRPELKSDLTEALYGVHGLDQERLFPDLDGFAGAHSASEPFPLDFFGDDSMKDRAD